MYFSLISTIVSGTTHLVEDLDVLRFSTDTRTLSGASDEIFIASKGKRDGHDFILEAKRRGVRNYIVEKEVNLEGCNVIVVENSIAAYQKIATHHRSQFDIPIISITGSNGKTMVKEWLSTILSEALFVIKNPKSYNSQVGVPQSLLEIRDIHEVGIFEAGISTVGEMENLEQMINPTHGIFTTLGEAHSEGFESDEQKLAEKLKLFRAAEQVICRSDQLYSNLLEAELGTRRITWSLNGEADYQVEWGKNQLRINGDVFETHLLNITDLENVTHAIIMALQLDLSHHQIQNGIRHIRPVSMRLELKEAINNCMVLDDSYNNDLQGLKVALEYMDSHKQKEKKTLILSDIFQSGMKGAELYAIVAKLIEERNITRLIGVGPSIMASKEIFKLNKEFYTSTEDLLTDFPAFKDELIVVKGARVFAFERIAKKLEKRTHGTVLEVNFEALQHNLIRYRNLLSNKTKLMVMVKANAYGSGILEVANFLQHQRVDMLGVAYVDEAILLRENGIHIPIMIMNPHVESFQDFTKYQLQAEIYGLHHLRQLLSSTDELPMIHLKIDTGMHRLGFPPEAIEELIELLKKNTNLKISGIFTHFAASDSAEHDQFTKDQASQFESIYQKIVSAIGYRPTKHACNSSGIIRWPQYHFDMVRLGIGLHGFDPTGILDLRTTSKLKTTISQIRNVKKGDTIGYSRKGMVKQDSKIAILPIGYEDGFLRVFGNGTAKVLIGNNLCPTIGSVCMDMTMVDVSNIDASEGDSVIIFGDHPRIQQLGEWADTIPYEILTNVSSRVKRVFIWE